MKTIKTTARTATLTPRKPRAKKTLATQTATAHEDAPEELMRAVTAPPVLQAAPTRVAPPELGPMPDSTLDIRTEPPLIEFIGLKGDIIPDVTGNFPIWKWLAMAYPVLARSKSDGVTTGVACDPHDAFEIMKLDPSVPYIQARLKTSAVTLKQNVRSEQSLAFGANISATATGRRTEFLPPPPPPALTEFDALTSRHRSFA